MKIIFCFLISLNLSAFTLNNNVNLTFDHDDVYINVAAGFCANIGITDSELLSIVDDAVNHYWNKSPTSRLTLHAGSLQSVSTSFHTGLICNSGTNCVPNPTLSVSKDVLISCNNNASNFATNYVLAVTVPNNTSNSTINGSLIILNDITPSNQLSLKSRSEIEAIIAHEIGHTFGLGHTPIKNALMYYATVPLRRSLGQDDIDGVTYLYPKEQPVSCGTIKYIKDKKGPQNFILTFLLGLFFTYLLKRRPRFSHSNS